ncbi:MAG: S8 family serine peptidase, partial [Thermoguttaceae bacterium]
MCVEQLEDRRLLSVSAPGDSSWGDILPSDLGLPDSQPWTVDAEAIALPTPLDVLDQSGMEVIPQLNSSGPLIGLDALRTDSRFSDVTGNGFGGSGPIGVAILDTGASFGHAALPNLAGGIDIADGDADATDVNGHGTHVAGIIGSNDSTFGGVAPGVNLYAVKVFSDSGGGSPFDVIEEGMQWVIANASDLNIRVVNMSLGSFENLQVGATGLLDDEIQSLEAMGIAVVAASGNDYQAFDPTFGQGYPAVNATLGVGAVWTGDIGRPYASSAWATDFTMDTDHIAAFSQRDASNPNHVMAPGAPVTSTWLDNLFVSAIGTSAAAPHVSGLVALLQDAALQFGGRSLSTDEVVDLIRSNSVTIFDGDDEDDNVFNTEAEYLRIDAYAAVEAVYDLFAMKVVGTTPAAGQIITSMPTEFTIDFSDPYIEATVAAGDLRINGTPADSVVMTDADTLTFQFATSPIVEQGPQKISMASGSVERVGDSWPAESFKAIFNYDEVPMEVVSTDPAGGKFSGLPLTGLTIDFNEPYRPESIGTDDLILSRGSVTGFSLLDADSVQYMLDGLQDDGMLTVEMVAGAVVDVHGNPMQAFVETVELDYGEVPYPVPLEQVSPAGSLIYDPSVPGVIGEEDIDSFLLLIDPGQKITVVVESDDALQPVIELFRLDGLDDGKGDGDDDDEDK